MGTLETSRNTACFLLLNRIERRDIMASVRAYSNRQPIRIPAYLFVVSSSEVSGCPAISPGDSALRQGNCCLSSPAPMPRQGPGGCTRNLLSGKMKFRLRRGRRFCGRKGKGGLECMVALEQTKCSRHAAAGELLWAAGSISASLAGGLVTSGGFLHVRERVLS